jgi:hypothetical protein
MANEQGKFPITREEFREQAIQFVEKLYASEDRLDQAAMAIIQEKTASPENVIYKPTVQFLDNVLDPEGKPTELTREEVGRVVGMGDRRADSYLELAKEMIATRGKTEVIDGEVVSKTAAFYGRWALAARTGGEIPHTSLLEQVSVGPRETGGDPPIVVEGISVLSALRDFGPLRHVAYEILSSRGAIFPEHYHRLPMGLETSSIAPRLEEINVQVERIYRALVFMGVRHNLLNMSRGERESPFNFKWRVLSGSLDLARQMTNGCFLVHMAMRPNNALAMREALQELSNSDLPETKYFADQLRGLAKQGLPTLMRHTEPSEYMVGLGQKRREITQELGLDDHPNKENTMRYINDAIEVTTYGDVERTFLAAFLATGNVNSQAELEKRLKDVPDKKIAEYLEKIFKGMTLHDKPPKELETVQVVGRFMLSAGALYDVIRHRLATKVIGQFSPYNGYVQPGEYVDMGQSNLFHEAMELNNEAYHLVASLGEEYEKAYGPYFVARAHMVPVTIRFSGNDIFHIVKLRGEGGGSHTDLVQAITAMERELRHNHPAIFNHTVHKR